MPGPVSDPGFHRSPAQVAGGDGEERAAAHLASKGLTIVSRNYRTRMGEVDLVARDGEVLVFVEVRMRKGAGYGGAPASVTFHKQRRIQLAAQMYLRPFRHPPRCRFDVVALEGGEVEWIRAAFECA